MADKPNRKRRTREHLIADLSVNHVERFILRCRWTAQRVSPDYVPVANRLDTQAIRQFARFREAILAEG